MELNQATILELNQAIIFWFKSSPTPPLDPIVVQRLLETQRAESGDAGLLG